MRTYHKIESVFKRDPDNRFKTFLLGEWSRPEFGYLEELPWVATEKIDGTNIRLAFSKHGYKMGGRTDSATIPAKLITHLQDVGDNGLDYDLEGLTLLGEGYGAGIQKGGGNYRSDQGFILFDVQVEETGLWLERENVEDIAKQLSIPIVPIMGHITSLGYWIARIREMAEGLDEGLSLVADIDRTVEGVVLRPQIELLDRQGHRIITKVKVKDFPQ